MSVCFTLVLRTWTVDMNFVHAYHLAYTRPQACMYDIVRACMSSYTCTPSYVCRFSYACRQWYTWHNQTITHVYTVTHINNTTDRHKNHTCIHATSCRPRVLEAILWPIPRSPPTNRTCRCSGKSCLKAPCKCVANLYTYVYVCMYVCIQTYM
jgi:hypothetical protein